MSQSKPTLNINLLIAALEGGTKLIELEQNHINDLNVFPVPDGDTGSNMNATIANGFEALKNTKIKSFKQLADVYSQGLLMNARGNSGVIFSQIMRGFTEYLSNFDNDLTPLELVNCFVNAKDCAYASVTKPVEGTILTVTRLVAEALANHKKFKNINEVFQLAYDESVIALNKTPEMLEVLKTVGVVDSGGYGLMTFLKGMNAVIQDDFQTTEDEVKEDLVETKSKPKVDLSSFINPIEGEGFGYCSEIILKLGDQIDSGEEPKLAFSETKFQEFLKKIGNSVVFVKNDNIIKVHVHTLKPYKLLQEAQRYGEFVKIKIENMNNQFYDKASKQGIDINNLNNLEDRVELIVTLPSYKLAKQFKENFGINHIIVTEDEGNPSIQTILQRVCETKAKNVIVIVDDSNVVLAVQQVAKLVAKKINVHVIATNNAFETGLVIANFEPTLDMRNCLKNLNNVVKSSISGLVSKSIKDVEFKKISVKKDDYIGIVKKEIVIDKSKLLDCAQELVKYLITNNKIKEPDQWLCHIIYGKNVSYEEALLIEKYANETYGISCSIEDGSQKTYDYIIGLESF